MNLNEIKNEDVFGKSVKVISTKKDKAMNLWGGYDDVTCMIGQIGTIVSISEPDTEYKRYRLKFSDEFIQMTQVRTNISFSSEELEIV
jgi:hypothetical protein